MMRPIIFLALCLLANTCLGQSIKVKTFEAITAKEVKVEPLADSVAVILTDRQPGMRTGAYLTITSDRKWATPVYDGIDITETRTPGEWIMFAPPGKYRVLLSEFDPEVRPRYTWHDIVISKGSEPPPTDPVDPPPPAGDFAAVTKAAREAADKLNDPPTRQALATAYKAALSVMSGKPYEDARVVVTQARFAVLNARKGNSQLVDWSTNWLKVVDAELAKLVPAGDVTKYRMAIEAIVKGLE